MLSFDPVTVTVQGGMDFMLPKMMRVRQHFSSQKITDIETTVRAEMQKLNKVDLTGKRIAVTAGSRKISNLPAILRVIVAYLKERGAHPFIVPAMGSHGRALAEGQTEMLDRLGINENTVGAPVISSMDTVALGTISGGYTVYCDKNAFSADGIIVCGRIKPHTSIRGKVESGLCKMMVVGLGKHRGAASFHKQGYHNLAQILPEGGQLFLEKAPILCGFAIIENAYDETAHLELVPREGFIEREAELLSFAKSLMSRFLLDEIDVLVVDQFGKDVSGAGMDPNITGRTITPLPMAAPVRIGSIVVLDITEASHGNATGIGGAEFTTRRVVKKIDFESMYTNVLTSGAVIAAQLPVIMNNDEEAVRTAIRIAPRNKIESVKVVRIVDTLHMGEILVSENYKEYLHGIPDVEIIEEGIDWSFDH